MERLLYPVDEAAQLLGVGKSKCYQLIYAGELPTVRVGRRRLVPREALSLYVGRLEATSSAA